MSNHLFIANPLTIRPSLPHVPANSPRELRFLAPIYLTGAALSHIPISFCKEMDGQGLRTSIVSPSHHDRVASEVTVRNRARYWYQWLYRLGRDVRAFTEAHYLRLLQDGDVCYLWPGCSGELVREVKRRGHRVVHERINCHQQTAKDILDAEYDREGLPATYKITQQSIREEVEELELGDLIFSPSPMVEASLFEQGVALEKILPSSYGWCPRRIAPDGPTISTSNDRPLRAVFVGRGCVRKGLHLLLRAWQRLTSPAELLVAGAIDEEMVRLAGPLLDRPNVRVLGHVEEIGPVFGSSDLFVFPSLEEGGPLVTYEACAAGVVPVVSPMGAGAIVRDGIEGVVLDPHDVDGWAAAMSRLLRDVDYRVHLAESAARRAADFTWERVADRRRSMLLERL